MIKNWKKIFVFNNGKVKEYYGNYDKYKKIVEKETK